VVGTGVNPAGDTEAWLAVLGDDIIDEDGDGILDEDDVCPSVADPDQADLDQDGEGDACDADDDGDGVDDAADNCAATMNADQADNDFDGSGDVCDSDDDADAVADDVDNCPLFANGDQADAEGDGFGDACDLDDDNDGVSDEPTTAPCSRTRISRTPTATGEATSATPTGNGDSFENAADNCRPMQTLRRPTRTPTAWATCATRISTATTSAHADNCVQLPTLIRRTSEADSLGDVCDPDDDGDGVMDDVDNCRS
jgi:hypothetical protein